MNENNYVLFERLLSERSKLGFSQAELAEKCGVTRNMVGRYERGVSVPGGDFLAAFAQAGADIYYILVGRRENEPQPVMLKPQELELLDNYRALNEADQKLVQLHLQAVLGRAVETDTTVTVRKRKNATPQKKG